MLRCLSNCFNVLFSLAEVFFFFCRWLFLVCCSYKFCVNIIVKAYLQVHLKIFEYNGKRSIFCHSFQKVKPIASLNIDLNISSIYFLKLWWTWLTDNEPSSHIKLQPNTSCPLKLNRFEPGQYLDGRPHGNTRVLLEEVLGRPVGSAHPAVCVGHPSIVVMNLVTTHPNCTSPMDYISQHALHSHIPVHHYTNHTAVTIHSSTLIASPHLHLIHSLT